MQCVSVLCFAVSPPPPPVALLYIFQSLYSFFWPLSSRDGGGGGGTALGLSYLLSAHRFVAINRLRFMQTQASAQLSWSATIRRYPVKNNVRLCVCVFTCVVCVCTCTAEIARNAFNFAPLRDCATLSV